MPNWQPNLDDVSWRFERADEAVAALRHAASELEATLGDRMRVARDAQREWRGAYRREFNGALSRIARRALGLAARYRETALGIRAASARAREEQRHREHERERWHREREDEERRRREREAQGE